MNKSDPSIYYYDISHINQYRPLTLDWTSIPLNIYRQTVFHIYGDLKQKLHRELARIDEARGDFVQLKHIVMNF